MGNWKQKADEMIRRDAQRSNDIKKRNQLKYGKKYYCHVCGLPSKGPSNDDYYKPSDLHMCSLCHNWVCVEHIHVDRCKKCCESAFSSIAYYTKNKIKAIIVVISGILVSILLVSSLSIILGFVFTIAVMIIALIWAVDLWLR